MYIQNYNLILVDNESERENYCVRQSYSEKRNQCISTVVCGRERGGRGREGEIFLRNWPEAGKFKICKMGPLLEVQEN